MSNAELAKEIALALINAGLTRHTAFNAANRIIKERLDAVLAKRRERAREGE